MHRRPFVLTALLLLGLLPTVHASTVIEVPVSRPGTAEAIPQPASSPSGQTPVTGSPTRVTPAEAPPSGLTLKLWLAVFLTAVLCYLIFWLVQVLVLKSRMQ